MQEAMSIIGGLCLPGMGIGPTPKGSGLSKVLPL